MKRRDFIVLAGAGLLSACGDNGDSNPPNAIDTENALPGVSDWVLTKPDSSQIEGYASTSVNAGSPVSVYVNTKSASYSADIYRLGWYGGAGASLKRQLGPFPGSVQALPSIDSVTGAASCSWNMSFSI